jgi:hypothetical protein
MLRSDDMRDDAKRLLDMVFGHMQSIGSDPQIGHKIEGILKETGLFSQVYATKVQSPYNPGMNSGQ